MSSRHRAVLIGVFMSVAASSGAAWAEPAKSLKRPGMPSDGYRALGSVKRSHTPSNLAALAQSNVFQPGRGATGRSFSGVSSGSAGASAASSGFSGGPGPSPGGGGSGGGNGGGSDNGLVGRAARALGI